MPWPTRLLPSAARVAISSLRADARAVVRAVSGPRFKGGRKREASWVPAVPASRSDSAEEVRATAELGGVVVFALSGVEVEVTPDVSILEAGLAAGVDLLFSCTMGGCAACMLQISEGQVGYEDRDAICLTDDELAEGACLACVGRPIGRVVVEA